MEATAPPVVAVVVAHDPGPWFEETLASLATQDYRELSVLVLDAAGTGDLTTRVASVLPTAYVRRLDENRGFGASVNEVRTMVDGAAYYLLCHDDVALLPDTVHLLVEEAFRSNAGIVSPKIVSWNDPERLIHVGMTADKSGAVVDRVHANEIDHGQHDAVRDVFLAPGGCVLVRADLFEVIGGFDPAIVAMGEDLDLCWRAQVAGARIIVAPEARVRHLEEVAAGRRELEPALVAAGEPSPDHVVTLQELQRRHELLAVFKCYGRFHLLRVVPQVVVLAIAEVLVAEVAGARDRARAVLRAWRWNLGRLGTIRRQRKELRKVRLLGDKEIRLLQVGGSARLSSYARRVFQHGWRSAHADEVAAADADLALVTAAGSLRLETTDVPSPAPGGALSGQTRLIAWLVAALVFVIGARGILSGSLPAIGQFTPFPSWGATFGQFFAGWHPSGVGTTAPAAPALAISGVVGTVLFGAMGLTQKVMVFACVPLGVFGMVRLLRPFGSGRAALVAGMAYLAMALPYDALATGRWGALVLYAGMPWVLARLFAATGIGPFGARAEQPPPEAGWFARHPVLSSMLGLGVLEAVLISFVPAAAFVVVLAAVGLVLSSLVFGDGRQTGRALGIAAGSTVVAGVICLPWLIGVLSAGTGALAVLGTPIPASSAASWGSLLRFAVGPIGDSPLAWGFAVAGVVPLVLARGERFRFAARLWVIAVLAWFVAWVIGRGWTGQLAIDTLVLLVPAAVAIAAAIGLGVAAFEKDLGRAEFGWRQLAPVIAVGAVALGALPTLVSALPGRFDLPVNDFSQSVNWMPARATSGAFRVLWLGDPRALNQGGWSVGDGLAYATSENGAPDARWLWNAASAGPAARLASAVDLARADGTDQLGRMLASSGVRYVVLLSSLAPEIGGEQNPEELPVPADVAPALSRQLDLVPVVTGTGITVYANAAWIPQRAETTSPPLFTVGSPGTPIVAARPVLPGPAAAISYQGHVATGTVLSAVAPAGRFELETTTGTATRAPWSGWASSYRVTRPGTATLSFDGGAVTPLADLLAVATWLAALAALLFRSRSPGRPEGRAPIVRRRRSTPRTTGAEEEEDLGLPLEEVAT
ncbi:MAG: glycosyltransferase family 2 protein [Acidimicrobiales bacterium]